MLKGNLAPDSCVVKRSAVVEEMMVHEGPARVFDCEEDAIAAIKGGKIVEGDVVVIGYEGPKGGTLASRGFQFFFLSCSTSSVTSTLIVFSGMFIFIISPTTKKYFLLIEDLL